MSNNVDFCENHLDMKVLSDADVCNILNTTLSRESLLNEYQPVLLKSLANLRQDPAIIPARTVETSHTEGADCTHLFMPCVGPHEVGLKVITGGPTNNANGLGFVGGIVVMDENSGVLKGLVNAKTITGFRTALASSIALVKALKNSELLPEITVFGVGSQAYWHVKLAMLLYPAKKINVVNRTLGNAQALARRLETEFGVQTSAFAYVEEYMAEDIASAVQNSSIVFGCTPSTEPIIKKHYINTDRKYVKFISLIGSYKPHMLELDLDFIRENYRDGTKLIVDSTEHALHEAGELIQTDFEPSQLVELAAVDSDTKIYTKNNVVVAKLVGLSIMDISMAQMVLSKAGGLGSDIDF